MKIHRGIGTVVAAALLLLWADASAFAHAELRRANPSAGGAVAAAPSEVSLSFSEPLEASFSSIVVRDAAGKRVDKIDARLDAKDRTTMRVSLPSLTRGSYIVVWRALTSDTHRTEGAYLFTVGE